MLRVLPCPRKPHGVNLLLFDYCQSISTSPRRTHRWHPAMSVQKLVGAIVVVVLLGLPERHLPVVKSLSLSSVACRWRLSEHVPSVAVDTGVPIVVDDRERWLAGERTTPSNDPTECFFPNEAGYDEK